MLRSKSTNAVFGSWKRSSTTYGVEAAWQVDDVLNVRHVSKLFPRLRDSRLDLELFYEVKATSGSNQLVTLEAGGVTSIQPGLESLNNEVLRLMKKDAPRSRTYNFCDEVQRAGDKGHVEYFSRFPGRVAAKLIIDRLRSYPFSHICQNLEVLGDQARYASVPCSLNAGGSGSVGCTQNQAITISSSRSAGLS